MTEKVPERDPEEPTKGDLLHVIQQMGAATYALRTLIEKQYPTRREMEQNFVRKEGAKRRFTLLLSTILVSSVVCFVATVATMSTCFLGDPSHPATCNIMPGYQETQDRTKQFEDLLEQQNKKIARLERQNRRNP